MISRFDAEKHEYWSGDERVPGFSEIVDTVGLGWNGYDCDTNRDFGTYFHACMPMVMAGEDVDLGENEAIMRPYIDAAERFRDNHVTEVWATEHMVHSIGMGYAGTLDIVGRFYGGPFTQRPCVLDWKTWRSRNKQAVRIAGMQTAAYERALKEQDAKRMPYDVKQPFGRAVVWFHWKGDEVVFDIIPLTDPRDWPAFVSHLNVWRWWND